MSFGLQDAAAIGPNTSTAVMRDTFAKAKDLGAAYWADNLKHDAVQTADPTKWYPDHGDRLFDLLDEYGLEPVVTIGGSAACNRPEGRDVRWHNVVDPGWLQLHETYVRYVADRWRGRTWELGNEPNNSESWQSPWGNPNPVECAVYVYFTARAIQETDPTAKVVTGGLSPGGTKNPEPLNAPLIEARWFAAVMLRWLHAWGVTVDGIGLHPYWSDGWPLDLAYPDERGKWNTFGFQSRAIRAMLDWLATYFDARWDVPIYATELGQQSAGTPARSEAHQAETTAAALDAWSLWQEGPAIVYRLRDDHADPAFPSNGILRVDGSEKPAAAMLRARPRTAVETARGPDRTSRIDDEPEAPPAV